VSEPSFPSLGFLGLVGHEMRMLLFDYARKHRAQRRGGDFKRVPLFKVEAFPLSNAEELLTLDDALNRLDCSVRASFRRWS
jgi:ECF sigma factor